MEDYERDFFVARIRAGYIPVKFRGKRILIYGPNNDILLEASEIYKEEYERGLEQDLLNDYDIYTFLIINDLWSEKSENEYTDVVPKHIEYWKKQLYQSALKSKTREKNRKYLDAAKKEYSRLHSIRHEFDYVTAHGYANYAKNAYIVSECSYNKGNKVDWSEIDLNLIMNRYYHKILHADTIRILSRTSPWSVLWPTLRANGRIFENVNLTEEQQVLLSWSIMYDKIHESPDCPSDDVIQDDDMLDGWLLLQREKREKESNQQEAGSTLSDKIQNSNEIFIPAETPEDAEKVDSLNSPHAQQIKKRRLKQLQNKGKMKQQEFSDVQLERSRQMREAYTQTLKGRKNG